MSNIIFQEDDKEKSLLGTFNFDSGELILDMFRVLGRKVIIIKIKKLDCF